MARPSEADQRRRTLIPIVAQTFADRGYRRTTTAVLAKRCNVRENVLYRLWRDKRAMFIAAIDFVYAQSAEAWDRLLAESDDNRPPAERLLRFESEHHGESGLQRLIFAGLSEANDPAIHQALSAMYGRFYRFVSGHIAAYRRLGGAKRQPNVESCAWAVIGLGTMASIAQELNILTPTQRKKVIAGAGQLLLEGKTAD